MKVCLPAFFALAVLLQAAPDARSQARPETLLYVARFSCGPSEESFQEGAARGELLTNVALHNISDAAAAAYRVVVSRALPFGASDAIVPLAEASLPAAGSTYIECDMIRTALPSSMTTEFRSGFVRITADRPLSVVATYTARSADDGVSTIAVETIAPVRAPPRVVDGGAPDFPDFSCDLDDRRACGAHGQCVRQADDEGNVVGTHCECDDGYAGATCEANLRPLRKRLNAGPGEFLQLRLPEPRALGERSRAWALDVDLDPAGCSWQQPVAIDRPGLWYIAAGPESVPSGGWSVSAETPAGAPFDGLQRIEEASGGGTPGYQALLPETGTWSLRVSAPSPCPDPATRSGYLTVSLAPPDEADAGTGLYAYPAQHERAAGGSATIVALAYDLAAFPDPPPDAASEEGEEEVASQPPQPLLDVITAAKLTVRHPNGPTDGPITMLDDGNGGDASAGDGNFAAEIDLDAPGGYEIAVDAQGNRDGAPFRRTAMFTVPVADRSVTIRRDGNFVDVFPTDPTQRRLRLSIPLQLAEGVDPDTVDEREFFVSTEVWGLDSNGRMAPVAWAGELRAPTAQQVADTTLSVFTEVELDGQWISNLRFLGIRIERLFLQRTRLHDSLTDIPISLIPEGEQEEVILSDEALDWLAAQNNGFVDPTEDREMLEGASPEFLEELETLVAAGTLLEEGRIMTVHGWCGRYDDWNAASFGGAEHHVPFVGWYTGREDIDFGGGAPTIAPTQVDVDRMADDMAAMINEPSRDLKIAAIVAYNSGAVAMQRMMGTTWTRFDAVFDHLKEGRLPPFLPAQALAGPFGGAGFLSIGPIRSIYRVALRREVYHCESLGFPWRLSPLVAPYHLRELPASTKRRVKAYRQKHTEKQWNRQWCRFTDKLFLVHGGASDGFVRVDEQSNEALSDTQAQTEAEETICSLQDMPEDLCTGQFFAQLEDWIALPPGIQPSDGLTENCFSGRMRHSTIAGPLNSADDHSQSRYCRATFMGLQDQGDACTVGP